MFGPDFVEKLNFRIGKLLARGHLFQMHIVVAPVAHTFLPSRVRFPKSRPELIKSSTRSSPFSFLLITERSDIREYRQIGVQFSVQFDRKSPPILRKL